MADLPSDAARWTPSTAGFTNLPDENVRTIQCAGAAVQAELEGGAAATAIAIRTSAAPGGRVWVGQGLAPLPVGGVIVAPGSSATIGCSGVVSISVAWSPWSS